jgi:hypothetical protein
MTDSTINVAAGTTLILTKSLTDEVPCRWPKRPGNAGVFRLERLPRRHYCQRGNAFGRPQLVPAGAGSRSLNRVTAVPEPASLAVLFCQTRSKHEPKEEVIYGLIA